MGATAERRWQGRGSRTSPWGHRAPRSASARGHESLCVWEVGEEAGLAEGRAVG